MTKSAYTSLSLIFSALFLFTTTTTVVAGWKDSMNQSWEKAKDSTIGLYKDYFPGKDISYCLQDKQTSTSFDSKWENVLNQLKLGSQKFQEIRKAPDNSWFGEDKKSLSKEFNTLLDQTIQLLLEDTTSLACWHKQVQLVDTKKQLQQQLTITRESLIVATGDNKRDLEQKVKDILDNLSHLQKQKYYIKQEMRESLRKQGLQLNTQQLDMLLARVDAKDILQMTITFDAVKAITRQLEKLMQANADNLNASKKYYAMYVVLSDMIVYIQTNYMAQLEDNYLPGIKDIIENTVKVQKQTQSLLHSATDSRKQIYKHNISAQKLTLKTAKLYYQHLQQQLVKIENAAKIAQKDLQLAKNTYETVQLSIELLNLIKTNRSNFQQLVKLQLPELIPLSNVAMEKEYQRLTLKLSE